jgi:hypothetical protein
MTTHKLRKVFLDTSAVIYHQHGHPLMVAAVEEVIGQRVVEVSNFIRMEYLRGVVINLIDKAGNGSTLEGHASEMLVV